MLCTGTAEPSTTMGISWRSSGSACSGGLAGVGDGRGRLASGAAAIPGVVPCDQDDDCQHACRDDRFELAAGVGGGTGKDLVRSVFQAGDARYVRRMFGYGRADPLYQSGRLWRGTGTRAR
jgi:hypothetical protein